MPTTIKKATSRKATPKPHSKPSNRRKVAPPLPVKAPPPTPLQLAVAELRLMGSSNHIEDVFENMVAYAIMSEDFHRENDFIPRYNYVMVAKYARRILVAALAEMPEIDPDPDLDLN